WSVTGVQTCALPIWGALSRYQRGRIVRLDPGQDRPATAAGAGRRAGGDPAPARRPQAERGPGGPPGSGAPDRRPAAQAPRPEEDRMMPVLLPMLATPAAPFDAPEYLFEVKWDGVRALAAVEAGHWRLWGRAGADYTPRYPELAVLGRLPSGTMLDGELVVLHDGRADFPALLSRHQRHRPDPLWAAAGARPVVSYVLFDLLFDRGQALWQETLLRRRARLRERLARANEPALVYSDGVVGCGRAFFAGAVAQGHEGVMAKRLSSRYRPGQRSRSWRKIKPVDVVPCVVVGYTAGRGGVDRLWLAPLRQRILR